MLPELTIRRVRKPQDTSATAWRRKMRRLLNGTIPILALLFFIAVGVAAQDTTPPDLITFAFTPTSIDTTSGDTTVTCTATITDPSDVLNASVVFRSPSVSQSEQATFTHIGGDEWSATLSFDQYCESGTWYVDYVAAGDSLNNSYWYFTPELQSMGFNTDLEITSTTQDEDYPELVSFAFNSTTIDTTGGSAIVVCTATVTDNLSGVQEVSVRFYSPSLSQSEWASFAHTGGNTYSAAITFDQGCESGTWYVSYVRADDIVGNSHVYYTSELQSMGFHVYLSVSDSAPPSVSAVAVSDLIISESDVSGAFTVTVNFSETMDTGIDPTLSFSPDHEGTLTGGTSSWTDSDTFTMTYTVADTDTDVDDIQVDVAEAEDVAGNPQQDYTPENEFEIDTIAPGVASFERLNPTDAETNADTLIFCATFDVDVQNVTAADFIATTTTAAVTNVDAVSATVYDLTVSGGDLADYSGYVGINLAVGQDIVDLAGNPLLDGEPGIDEMYLVDNTDPIDPTPTSASHTVSVWSNDDTIDIVISGASDTDGSGVDGFETAWDQNATWTPTETKSQEESWIGATFTATSDGDWYFHIATVDNAGNWTSTQHLGPFQIDTIPPELISFSFTPTSIDTTSGDATVTCTATVEDDLSGIERVYICFRSPSDSQVKESDLIHVEGNTYSITITIKQYCESGTWYVDLFHFLDASDNRHYYYTADLQSMGFNTDLEVTSTPDANYPELVSFSFTPMLIDTISGSATVTCTATITDDISGVDVATVRFHSPSESEYEVENFVHAGGNTYSATLTFDQYCESGTWYVLWVYTRDNFYNSHMYNTSDLQSMGFNTDLEVSDTDITPPSVSSVAVSDTLLSDVDAGETFTVTIDFSETMDTGINPTISFSPDHGGTLTSGTPSWPDSDTFTMTYTVANTDIDVDTVQIDVTGAEDVAGNSQQDYTPENEFEIDTLEPTPDIDLDHMVCVDPTAYLPVYFAVDFGESVSGFESSDVIVGGTAIFSAGPIVTVSGPPSVYQVRVDGTLSGDGTVTISIGADAAVDTAGNSSNAATVTDNSVTVDTTDPIDPTPTSTSHTVSVWSNDDTIDIVISGASDTDGSGVDGFETAWDQNASWTPTETKNQEESWIGATFTATSDGDWYFHIATTDNVGNWTSTQHLGPFHIDTTPPSVPSELSPADGEHTNDASPTFSWNTSTDTGGSGIRTTGTYRVVITGAPSRDYYTANTRYTPTLAEGVFTWKVYSRDNAGNCSVYTSVSTANIDTTDPTDPAPSSSSHMVSVASSDNTVDVTISGASDPTSNGVTSGVDGFETAWDQSATWTPTEIKDQEETWTGATFTATSDGDWYFHIATVDNTGNWTSTEHLGPFQIDTTPPVITLTGVNPQTIECSASYVELAATVTDDCCVTDPVIIDASAADTATVGSYSVTYNVIDCAGNAAVQVTRTVNVVDTTPPVVTLNGPASLTLECGVDTYTELGAIVTDECCPGALVIAGATVDVSTSGTYEVTYDSADCNGNPAAQVARTITVVDTTPPVITLTGVNPQTIECSASYVELAATVTDDCCVTDPVTIDASAVDTATVGSYSVTYNVIDCASNAAVQVTRTVNVVDTTPPRVRSVKVNDTLISDADTPRRATFKVTVDFDTAMNTSIDPTFVFDPGVATTLTLNVRQSRWADDNTYVSRYDVADSGVDEDSVTIDVEGAQDLAGNGQQGYTPRHEFEIDTENPTVASIARLDPSPTNADTISWEIVFSEEVQGFDRNDLTCTVTGTGTYNFVGSAISGSGDTYTYELPEIAGDGTISLVVHNVRTIEDLVGNQRMEPDSIDGSYSVDNTPPIITDTPAYIATMATSSEASTVVTWDDPTATDAGSGIATFTATHPSGTSFPIGTTTVTYTAIDAASNATTASFNVTVSGYVVSLEVVPHGEGDGNTFLDRVLPLEEGEDPPTIGSYTLAATFEIGETIAGSCLLLDSNGNPLVVGYVVVKLYHLTFDSDEEFLEQLSHDVVIYDLETNCYEFSCDTSELEPGYYIICLAFPDGTDQEMCIEVVAAVE